MVSKKRNPLLGESNRASGKVIAGGFDNPEYSKFPLEFQSIGSVAAAIVERISAARLAPETAVAIGVAVMEVAR